MEDKIPRRSLLHYIMQYIDSVLEYKKVNSTGVKQSGFYIVKTQQLHRGEIKAITCEASVEISHTGFMMVNIHRGDPVRSVWSFYHGLHTALSGPGGSFTAAWIWLWEERTCAGSAWRYWRCGSVTSFRELADRKCSVSFQQWE